MYNPCPTVLLVSLHSKVHCEYTSSYALACDKAMPYSFVLIHLYLVQLIGYLIARIMINQLQISICLPSLVIVWLLCEFDAICLHAFMSSQLNNPYFHSACICFISSFPPLSLPSFLFLLLQKKSSTGQIEDEPDVQIDISDLSVDMQRNDLNNHAFLRNASSPAVTCATRHQHRPAKRYRSK